MTKVVYITGCLGFMGSYLTREMLKIGWYVRGVDKVTYAANISFLNEFGKYSNFTFEKLDINNIEFLYDCDYIINMAAETHVDNSIINSDTFIHSNINGVHHLLELIRNFRNPKKPTLIHVSTDEVYGDIKQGRHRETDLLKPSNPYSATKAAGDMLILAWARTYNIPYIIVRPTNNYGIGQYVEKLIPKTCKFLTLNRKIPLHDRGTPKRMWLHAQDTAHAIVKIIENGTINQIYNISGDFEQTNFDTVKKILQVYFKKDMEDDELWDYVEEFARSGQDMRYDIDDSKLRNLGWNPKIKFDDAIIDIVKYYKENFIW